MVEKVAISLGGSVICPDTFDYDFTVAVLQCVNAHAEQTVLVCGGGKTCRSYMQAIDIDADGKDRIGISITHVHARCVYEIGRHLGLDIALTDGTATLPDAKIIVLGGTVPGQSTDAVAVSMAERIGARTVINISNTSHIYSAHPDMQGATKLTSLTWTQLQQLVGDTFTSGAHVPFDAVAVQKAMALQLQGVFIGKDVAQLTSVLDKQEWQGTVVTP